MAVSYKFCNIKKSNNQDEYFQPLQLTLEGMEEEAECNYKKVSEGEFVFTRNEMEPNITSLSLGNFEIPKLPDYMILDKYEAYIDIVVNKKGKVYHQVFNKYLEPNQFNFYTLSDPDLFIFSGVSKQVSAQFLKEINKDTNSGLNVDNIAVNFRTLQPLIPVISGVWFGDINKQYLSSAGYFGNNVDKSEEFQKALSEEAQISELIFKYVFKGDIFTIGITKDCAIILYSRIKDPVSKLPDLRSELLLVIQIFNNFILPGIEIKIS